MSPSRERLLVQMPAYFMFCGIQLQHFLEELPPGIETIGPPAASFPTAPTKGTSHQRNRIPDLGRRAERTGPGALQDHDIARVRRPPPSGR